MGSVASVLAHSAEGVSGSVAVVDDIDLLRAQHYDLLATLLGRAPDVALLDVLRTLEGGEGALGRHLSDLSRAAATTSANAVEREFFALFVGVGRGELLPYASYYLTGFLNERPLARVREDLSHLGIERGEAMSEPEDHLAILFEVMAGLASGRFEAEPGMQPASSRATSSPGRRASSPTSNKRRRAGSTGPSESLDGPLSRSRPKPSRWKAEAANARTIVVAESDGGNKFEPPFSGAEQKSTRKDHLR